ncbi:unnamed protein product [Paramecium pentaurelia]|uniref:Transmembrane protein n=1 Tax=Paramecium pentaurelia TaxID=43138 RepID=A0A8S1UKK4_9CILI|nr:unnamed protein product [Paramecium pentaurelia]
MVYVYIDQLPQEIKKHFKYTQDPLNPQNYAKFSEIKLYIDQYNDDHIDQLKIQEIIGTKFIMQSDLQALQIAWEADHRPKEILDEIRAREMRCKDRAFIQKSSQLTKGVFQEKKQESIKEYEKSVNFGLSFIFSIFASGLLGYYLGIYFFQLTYDQSLALAAFFLIGALIVETGLYIVKIMKEDRIRKINQRQNNKQNKTFPTKFKKE